MNIRTLLTAASVALAAMLATVNASAPPTGDAWSLKRSGDEMWVYTRNRAGSDIKEVKLVMNVEASIEDLNKVLNAPERQPEWVFRCLKGKDLGGDIASGWYYYSLIDMPWPMEDRDVVAKVTGSRDGLIYTSHTVAAPKRAPKVEGVVRLTTFEVTTSYKTIGSGQTQVTYQLYSEPGGAVPTWLVNLFVDKGPVETMTKLRDLVEG